VLQMDGRAAVLEVPVCETAVLWRAAAPGIEKEWGFDGVGVRRSCCLYTSESGS
jgi:hypothetical protein